MLFYHRCQDGSAKILHFIPDRHLTGHDHVAKKLVVYRAPKAAIQVRESGSLDGSLSRTDHIVMGGTKGNATTSSQVQASLNHRKARMYGFDRDDSEDRF